MNEVETRKYTQINYKLVRACALCVDRSFKRGKVWGHCKKHTYQHPSRGTLPIKIHLAGRCGTFELDPNSKLGAYRDHIALESREDKMTKAINVTLKR